MTTTTWYRRSLWNYKGNREYTKSGYDVAHERFNPNDLEVDCSDRHYVITGSNSGIGFEIAREIAKRGGVLHMVCRNFETAKQARSDLITNTGNDKIHIHILDLSRPRDVAEWAQNFALTHEKIHVLVNNAGCMVHEKRIDEDGIETNFAVNTLAVHIITMTLLPILQKNEDARVITVSSAGMLVVRLDPIDLMQEDVDPFNGTIAYSQNKRQQVVMTLWYAQRYDKVHFSVMHPGWADTPAVRNSLPEFYEMMKGNLRSPLEGADTAIWLAISKGALKYPSGFFFQDREPASTHLPLAWTKTSMEEENLLMQKLMVLMQKVSSHIVQEETKSTGDNISEINVHTISNGIKVPFEADNHTANGVEKISTNLSTVSLSKSEDEEIQDNVEKEVAPETQIQSPVPKDEEDHVSVDDTPERYSAPQPSINSNEDPASEPSSAENKEDSSSVGELTEEQSPDSQDVEEIENVEAMSADAKEETSGNKTDEEIEPEPQTPTAETLDEPKPETPTAEMTDELIPETPSVEKTDETTSHSPQEEEKEIPTHENEETEAWLIQPTIPGLRKDPSLETEETGAWLIQPTIPGLRKDPFLETANEEVNGDPVVEDLLGVTEETETEVPQTPTEALTPSNIEASLIDESVPAETQESVLLLISSESTANDSNNVVSPTPSEITHQNAASVVEHLIDITAERAAASMSS